MLCCVSDIAWLSQPMHPVAYLGHLDASVALAYHRLPRHLLTPNPRTLTPQTGTAPLRQEVRVGYGSRHRT